MLWLKLIQVSKRGHRTAKLNEALDQYAYVVSLKNNIQGTLQWRGIVIQIKNEIKRIDIFLRKVKKMNNMTIYVVAVTFAKYCVTDSDKTTCMEKERTLQWRHNGLDGVSNHQPHHCLLSRLFGRRSKKTSKLRVTGLCVGNSPGTGEFPAQMASNADNVSIWWRHQYKGTIWDSTKLMIRVIRDGQW